MEDINSIDREFQTEPPSQTRPAETARLLSIRLDPGFRCFFQNWVQSQKMSIFECYDLVLKSHLNLERLRWPTKKLLARDDLTLSQKSQELFSRSTQHQRFFLQSRHQGRYKNNYAQEKEEQLKQLEMQVELYRRRREEALEAKREQFKKISNQQEEVKRKTLQEQQRRQRVLDDLRREQEAKLNTY